MKRSWCPQVPSNDERCRAKLNRGSVRGRVPSGSVEELVGEPSSHLCLRSVSFEAELLRKRLAKVEEEGLVLSSRHQPSMADARSVSADEARYVTEKRLKISSYFIQNHLKLMENSLKTRDFHAM